MQTEYVYNALGQKVIRRLTQTGETIHSVHDMDGNRIAEYLYDDVAGTSTLLREYIWLEGTPFAVYENEVMYYIRTDHIGRPVFATDDNGTKVWEASYLPFGGVHTSSGTPINLRFPGQWFQSESGLHQNWMRDYDPTTGRYIQADPLGLVDGASVYGYALQNPGRYVDPRGELAIPAFCVGPQAVYCAGGVVALAIWWYLLQTTDFCPLDIGDDPFVFNQMPDPAAVDKSRSGRRKEMGAPSADPDSDVPQGVVDDYYGSVGGPFSPESIDKPGRQIGTTGEGGRKRRDTTSPHSDGFGRNPRRR